MRLLVAWYVNGAEFIISSGESWNGCGRMEFFRMVWSYHLSRGKVVSVSLLTDRNYVSKSAVYWSFFICYLRRGWNFWVSGIVHSWKVVNNRYQGIDEGPVKPIHLRGGTKCCWLKWDNDWLRGWDNRPVNPMHLREKHVVYSLECVGFTRGVLSWVRWVYRTVISLSQPKSSSHFSQQHLVPPLRCIGFTGSSSISIIHDFPGMNDTTHSKIPPTP